MNRVAHHMKALQLKADRLRWAWPASRPGLAAVPMELFPALGPVAPEWMERYQQALEKAMGDQGGPIG